MRRRGGGGGGGGGFHCPGDDPQISTWEQVGRFERQGAASVEWWEGAEGEHEGRMPHSLTSALSIDKREVALSR